MLVLRNLAEMFIRALAVGLAEQRMRGVYGQYTSRPHPGVTGNAIKRSRTSHPHPGVTGNAIKRSRTSHRYNGQEGARATERRARQLKAGQLRFHSYGR